MPPNALCRLKVGFELSHILSLDDVFRIWIVRSRVEPWPSHNAKQFAPTMPPPLSLSLSLSLSTSECTLIPTDCHGNLT